MSVSQNMMALFNSVPSQIAVAAGQPSAGKAASGDNVLDFGALLAEQDPAKLDALLQQLATTEGEIEEGLSLAVDGKDLPESVQDWLGQLASLEAVEGGENAVETPVEGQAPEAESDQWFKWLSESRLTLLEVPAVAEEAEAETETLVGDAGEEAEAEAELSPLLTLPTAVEPATSASGGAVTVSANAALTTATATQGLQTTSSTVATDGQAKAGSDLEITSTDAQRKGSPGAPVVELNQAAQRNVPVTPAASEAAAFAGKLAEQLDAIGGKKTGDNDSVDSTTRSLAATQPAAQAALTARPVAAAAQALGVPFGQQGWGEAMVEKVMWASSQNLRSVEIHLDPAELGPLEIHIQQRGQEQQIQFVSQNASVREALESQMYRLREMFAQQGMNQVNVSVGDSSAGQQSARDQQFASNRGNSGRGQDNGPAGIDGGDSIITSAAAARVSADRLVDYYA